MTKQKITDEQLSILKNFSLRKEWEEFRNSVIPESMPDREKKNADLSFYAGFACAHQGIYSILEYLDPHQATEILRGIDKEVQEFITENIEKKSSKPHEE